MDIKNRSSFIDIFILSIDILNIILFTIWCYLNFKNFNTTNVDNLWNINSNIHKLEILLLIMIPIKHFLENQKEKNTLN